MTIISIDNLTKRYGPRTGVDDVCLTVQRGSIFGFLGPNGAGKTTAIRVLLGLLRPTAGGAAICGRDCWREGKRIRQDIGYIPGDLRLYPWMTGHNASRLLSRVRGGDRATHTRSFHVLGERFELEMSVPVRAMSRGMRQKLGLIMALAHEPALLILDEPTGGLDPLMQDELANLLRERAANGATVFFSSHTLAEVEQLCDHIAMIRAGRIVVDETLSELRSRAKRMVVVQFIRVDEAQRCDPPQVLDVLERSGKQWRAELTGATPALLSWASGQAIEDMTIGQPDLESMFRRHYQSSDEPAEPSS